MKRSETSTDEVEWKLEPELTGPIPRRIALRRWDYLPRVIIWAIIALFFLGAGLFFLWVGVEDKLRVAVCGGFLTFGVAMLYVTERNRRLSRLLVSTGTATRGIIVERKNLGGRGRGGGDLYKFLIAYDTPHGDSKTSCFDTGGKVGDTLTVLYLPETPEQAKPYRVCSYKAVASQT